MKQSIMWVWSVLGLLAAAEASSFTALLKDEQWAAFKSEHQKQYSAAEDELRKQIFAESQLKVARHNQRFARGLTPFRVKINQFSDMLHSEFLEAMTEAKANGVRKTSRLSTRAAYYPWLSGELPRNVDWRELGAVSNVKAQGSSCKASWAFSAAGALEGQYFRKTGDLESLSAQNLLDCSSGYGNDGCQGGEPAYALEYVLYNGGIQNDSTYPYRGKDNLCLYNAEEAAADCPGYVQLAPGDELDLQAAVATVGPVAVVVDASQPAFSAYAGGVYRDRGCGLNATDHLVYALVVGYGTDQAAGDYWLVKTSWGSSWGDKGYIKMARNDDNHCGIADDAIYPMV